MESELLRIFTENHEPIGVASREIVHEKGYWHETFHYWLLENRRGELYIYLQLRSPKKKDHPGLLDITAAGHLLANETVEDGIREVEEEIGIAVTFEELIYLGVLKYSVKKQPLIDNELSHVFLHKQEVDFHTFSLQDEEVSGMYRTKFADFESLWMGGIKEIYIEGFEVENQKRKFQEKWVGRKQFVPHEQSFYKELIYKIKKKMT